MISRISSQLTPFGVSIGSITVASIAFLFSFFYFVLADWMSWTHFFLMPFVLFILWGTVAISLFFSLLILRRIKREGWIAALPTGVSVLTVLAILFFPFTRLWLYTNFYIHKAERNAVVKAVNNGELTPNVDHSSSLIKLPDSYSNLSFGGNEINVLESRGTTFVFFYTYRGLLDNYAGFLHVENGGNPSDYSFSTELISLSEDWYYISY